MNSKLPKEMSTMAVPVSSVGKRGFRFAIIFTDDYSGAVFVYFLKQNSDAPGPSKQFLAESRPF